VKIIKGLKAEDRLIVLSAACALLAGTVAFLWLTWKEKNILSGMQPVKVIAAAKLIPSKSRVDAGMVEWMELPKRYVTAAHITDYKQAKGKLAIVPFIKGEPIMANKLMEEGEELNTAIPDGMRAVSVSVNEETGVGFMIKPGDHVDVLVTMEMQENGKAKMITATIIQAARVAATGNEFSGEDNNRKYDSVTLALAPEDAELLSFAREKGRVSLALRPVGDTAREKVRITSFNELIARMNRSMKEVSADEKENEDIKQTIMAPKNEVNNREGI